MFFPLPPFAKQKRMPDRRLVREWVVNFELHSTLDQILFLI